MIEKRVSVPFHLADIGDREIEAVVETLKSGWLTTGSRARQFETEFAAYIGAAHGVALNSATAGLHLALEAAGVREGDEVIVPTMTFAASAEVVAYLRAKPVLVDCDPDTLTVRAEDIAPAIGPRTKAIMPVHYGGHPCEMDPILELAKTHKLAVIEDAAHALPAAYRGRRIGTIGDLTVFSFYATKTLTTGEGGMVTTDDPQFADRMRLMSLHGISRHAWNRYSAEGSWRYEILAAGFKYNLTDIAAALGLAQLRRVDEMASARRRVATAYNCAFSSVPELQVPVRHADVEHAWHLYPIRLRLERLRIGRDAFIEGLKEQGIGTSVHFIPLHLHPYYREASDHRADAFPVATEEFGRLISLPIYPAMTDHDIERVTGAVIELATVHRR